MDCAPIAMRKSLRAPSLRITVRSVTFAVSPGAIVSVIVSPLIVAVPLVAETA